MYVVVVLVVLGSYLAARMTGDVVEAEQVSQFQREETDAALRMEAALQAVERAVTATAQGGWPGRLQWRELAGRTRASYGPPGLVGMVFVRRVTAAERTRYETSVKGDQDVHPKGHPNFLIFPVGVRPEYFVVHDYEPWTGNLTAVGYDLGSDPGAYSQLERAAETGEAGAFDRFSDKRQKGFFLAVPVYDGTIPLDTTADRRQALTGFAVGVVDSASLVESALSGVQSQHLSLEVEEVGQESSFLVLDLNKEHDARTGGSGAREIQLWGRTWRLHASMLPGSLTAVRQSVERRVFFGGLSAGSLLSLLLGYYMLRHERALKRVAQVTRELRDTQERFAETFGPSNVGMALASPDGRFLQVNAAFCCLLGYTEAELLQVNFADVTHPDDAEGHRLLAERLHRGELPYFRIEQRYVRKDGEIVRCQVTVTHAHDSHGESSYFIVQAEDLTAQRRAEAAARKQEELYRIVAENTSDLVALHDAHGTCVYISPSCRAILGFTAEEYNEADLFALVHERDRPAVIQAVNEARTGGTPRCTYQVQHKSGEYVWLETDFRAVFDSERRFNQLQTCSRDVTVRRQVEQLRESFVASASHELRSPLAALSAVVEAMRDGLIPAENYPRYHDRALAEIHRLRRLTDELLLLSQLKAGLAEIQRVEFDVRSLLQGMHERWVLRCAAAGITLHYDCPELRVRADCDRIEQVLVAFLDNAVRYTPSGGEIRLFAEPHDRGVRLGVQDSGAGIAPEHLPLIWERFYKVDRARSRAEGGGSGLGLSIVREVATRMGGSVHVESEVGTGSVFSITLPDAVVPPAVSA